MRLGILSALAIAAALGLWARVDSAEAFAEVLLPMIVHHVHTIGLDGRTLLAAGVTLVVLDVLLVARSFRR